MSPTIIENPEVIGALVHIATSTQLHWVALHKHAGHLYLIDSLGDEDARRLSSAEYLALVHRFRTYPIVVARKQITGQQELSACDGTLEGMLAMDVSQAAAPPVHRHEKGKTSGTRPLMKGKASKAAPSEPSILKPMLKTKATETRTAWGRKGINAGAMSKALGLRPALPDALLQQWLAGLDPTKRPVGLVAGFDGTHTSRLALQEELGKPDLVVIMEMDARERAIVANKFGYSLDTKRWHLTDDYVLV